MPGGNPVLVDLINQERAPSRGAVDQTGASGRRLENTRRWRFLVGAFAGQDRRA